MSVPGLSLMNDSREDLRAGEATGPFALVAYETLKLLSDVVISRQLGVGREHEDGVGFAACGGIVVGFLVIGYIPLARANGERGVLPLATTYLVRSL